MRLILDVDTGIDDALALLYACASPEAELVAVTCVAGNVPLEAVVANTLAVLELAGRADIPVHAGADGPLAKALRTTEETHGRQGIGYATLAAKGREPTSDRAAAAIVDIARARPGDVQLVTLGPLTNLAWALGREVALPSLLAGWTMMGGAFGVPGNTTPTSEWNVHVDPDALEDCLVHWETGLAEGAGPMWARPVAVDVEVGPGLAHGMTVADWRGAWGREPNVDVAIDADPATFIERFVERIGGLAAAQATAPG